MNKNLRTTGIVFAIASIAGFAVNFIVSIQKPDLMEALFHPYQLFCIGLAILFLLSALSIKLSWIQPTLFLASSPAVIISNTRDIYGLGFFIMGVLMLERVGFFIKHRAIKVLIVLSYLVAIEIAGAVLSKNSLLDALAPTFFIVAFGVFLWFLYKDRFVVILKEPKPKLSLAEKGLSTAERAFIGQTLAGKSQKEISIDFELSESTVRNTLARAYKKLDIEDRVGLAVLGERFEIDAD